MTAPAVAEAALFAVSGQPECGEKNEAEHVRCARPCGHKGGHVDRVRKLYWQAEEPAASTVPHCGARWPNRGPAGDFWTCTLDRGHERLHEAHGPRGKLLSLASDDEVTWDDEEAQA